MKEQQQPEKEWNLGDERNKFKKNLDYALGKFNWGNSALDADAIVILNEWKIMLDNQDEEFIKRLKKIPIDELCECGHSKKSHGYTNLDNHGGNCNQCKCYLYTWQKFVFMDKIDKLVGKEK